MSGGNDRNVMLWDVASACGSSSGSGDGDASASLADQLKPAGEGSGSTGAGVSASAVATVGVKRKKGAPLWSSRGDGPSHGPVHSFPTRNTDVYR